MWLIEKKRKFKLYTHILKLIELIKQITVSTDISKQGFSSMNIIKTTCYSLMRESILHDLMIVNSYRMLIYN